MNNIQVTKEDFAKISKRLCKQLESQSPEEISLSKTQEQLALAFGFRNYNGINSFFTKGETEIKEGKKSVITQQRSLYQNMTSEQFLLIFENFINRDKNNMWGTRAMTLASAIIPALLYMRDIEDILLDIDVICDYLVLDNMIKLYKTRRKDFPTAISNELISYLRSLPSYQDGAPKQNDTTSEQHGHLQMQFYSVLKSLKKIEKQNILILPASIVNIFTSINKTHDYSIIMLRSEIVNIKERWEDWENSNFLSEHIVNLIMANKTKLQGKDLYIHDLIQLSFNYMNEKKRHDLFNLLFEFINNLTLTKQYSSEVIAIFDK
jgi:hypothetical protein